MSTPFKMDCNVAQLVQMMESNKINYDGAVQRGYAWDKKRNSRLMRSIMLGRSIGMFNFNQLKKNNYEALDGKQRSNAIREFVNGNYAIHARTKSVIDSNGNEVEIAKRKFKDLPDDLKMVINSYGLIIYCYDNINEDEKREIFEDINNGKPVSATELTRIRVQSREVFQVLSRHDAIQGVLSSINKKKGVGEDLVEQIWAICYEKSNSLLNKDLAPVLAEVEVTEEEKQGLEKILDYLVKLLADVGTNKKLSRKMKAKTHIVSLGYMAFLSIQKGMNEEEFISKAVTFFACDGNKATVSDDYNAAVNGGAKAEQVKTRMQELEKALS